MKCSHCALLWTSLGFDLVEIIAQFPPTLEHIESFCFKTKNMSEKYKFNLQIQVLGGLMRFKV